LRKFVDRVTAEKGGQAAADARITLVLTVFGWLGDDVFDPSLELRRLILGPHSPKLLHPKCLAIPAHAKVRDEWAAAGESSDRQSRNRDYGSRQREQN
jgi:hypothetical protein